MPSRQTDQGPRSRHISSLWDDAATLNAKVDAMMMAMMQLRL
jgi:hypothetical protein